VRRYLVAGALAAVVASIVFFIAARASQREDRRPSLEERVAIFEGSIPGFESEDYVPPSASEASRVAAAIARLDQGDPARARAEADGVGYSMQEVPTQTLDRNVYLFRETGDELRGWGVYFLDTESRRRLLIEAPHTQSDRATELVATDLFEATEARYLLIAGANRYANSDGSADVSHFTPSVFQAVQDAVLRPGDTVVAIHGFAAEEHADVGDVVLSSGSSGVPDVVAAVAEALRANGFRVCVYRGDECSDLAGTTDVQGRTARAADASFLHVELADHVRSTVSEREKVVSTIATALLNSVP
jgi:hypothetical protein